MALRERQELREQTATLAAGMDAETFRTHRERLKATQAELAAALDVHQKTLGRWERGVMPVPEAVARLVERMQPSDVGHFAKVARRGRAKR